MATHLLRESLNQLAADLAALRRDWALVGGLAYSALADPRTTQDVDVVVAVTSDREAEGLIRDLAARGYGIHMPIEQEAKERLATVRLISQTNSDVIVDLLFASSGIEREIVELAASREIFPGLQVPIAQRGHLVALKVLAGRPQDLSDAKNLLRGASPEDLQMARESLDLIDRRGYERHKDLQAELGVLLEQVEREDR